MFTGSGEDENLRKIVRLHHRRRGWAWAGFGSLIGLVVYFVIGDMLFNGLAGTILYLTYIPLLVLFVIAVVGIVAVIADTVRLAAVSREVRAAARPRVEHHPVYAHVHRGPKHVGSWIAGLLVLAAMTALMVVVLPMEVNGVAYLTGAAPRATFHAVRHERDCGKGGCSINTDGYLTPSGIKTTLIGDVPIGSSESTREPAWHWLTGTISIDSTGGAVGELVMGLFPDLIAGFTVYNIVMAMMFGRKFARRSRQHAATAAGPTGVR